MIVLANAYKAPLLDLERATLNSYFYGLFVNNVTPDGDTAIGDLVEPTFDTGYAATGRGSPGFVPATLNGDDQGELVGLPITWTFDHNAGDLTVYGYFVATSSSGGFLVYSERDPAPLLVDAAGRTYTVTPRKIMDTY